MTKENPYNPPVAEVSDVDAQNLITGDNHYAEELTTLGRITLGSILLALLGSIWGIYALFSPGIMVTRWYNLLELSVWVLFSYLLLGLQSLLQQRYQTYHLKWFIYIVIVSGLLVTVASLLNEVIDDRWNSSMPVLALVVINGFAGLLFALKLRKVKDISSSLVLYTWLSIATAVTQISIVLLVLAAILSLVSSGLLAKVFFEAAHEFRETE